MLKINSDWMPDIKTQRAAAFDIYLAAKANGKTKQQARAMAIMFYRSNPPEISVKEIQICVGRQNSSKRLPNDPAYQHPVNNKRFWQEVNRQRKITRERALVKVKNDYLAIPISFRVKAVRAARQKDKEAVYRRKILRTARNLGFSSEDLSKLQQNWHTCQNCDGYGLTYIRRRHDGYDAKCKFCSGRGEVKICKKDSTYYKRLELVIRKVQNGENLKDTIQNNEGDDWDETITSTWLKNGEIDDEQAKSIREKCRIRHEETNYDGLLLGGVSREDAREIIR